MQDLIEPLIFLTAKDYELSSELFLQIVDQICFLSMRSLTIMKDTLIQYIEGSKKCNYNFISTIEKCLIRIAQKHHQFFNISIKEIAIQSNTLDYSVLFTE